MLDSVVRFAFPTTICFGPGAAKQLPACLEEVDIVKPLLVTDPGLRKTEAYIAIEGILRASGIPFAVYDEVHPNPVEDDVEQAAEAFRAGECDGVIGLGGGSALDVAKVVLVRATHEGPLSLYEAQAGGVERIHGPLPPMIAIPTTAGTGSEVGRGAVITVPSLGRKILVFHPLLMPKRAIADPELTVSLPPLLTAATGMDAFTHNLESLTAPVFHPLCDAIAIGGIELVANYLERTVKDGRDIEARGYMMIAAMMGAIAFQKDLGAAHSLAHPLSTEFGVHHGMANAICLVPVMRFNRDVAAKAYAKVARCFGINTFGMSDFEAAEKAIDAVADLNRRIGIPGSLGEVGIEEEALALLARKAFEDSCHKTNPRPCSEEDLLMLYKEAYGQ